MAWSGPAGKRSPVNAAGRLRAAQFRQCRAGSDPAPCRRGTSARTEGCCRGPHQDQRTETGTYRAARTDDRAARKVGTLAAQCGRTGPVRDSGPGPRVAGLRHARCSGRGAHGCARGRRGWCADHPRAGVQHLGRSGAPGGVRRRRQRDQLLQRPDHRRRRALCSGGAAGTAGRQGRQAGGAERADLARCAGTPWQVWPHGDRGRAANRRAGRTVGHPRAGL